MPYISVAADGGLDLITAPQAVQAGRLISCQNYEVSRQRGYRRIDGYEKYDGGQSPSFASTSFMEIAGGIVAGQHISNYAAGKSLGLLSIADINGVIVAPNTRCTVLLNNSFYDGVNTNIDVVVFLASAIPNSAVTCFIGNPSLNSITRNVTIGNVAATLTAASSIFSTVSATVQAVPGQGNVNGFFWLKDKLYATRDYLAFTFTVGSVRPNPGDVLYQGASLGAATWTGTVAKVVTDSGTTWGASPGTATGTIMVYNTTNGTTATSTNILPTAATAIKNSTQGNVATCTAGAAGTSTAAGLYVATGGRGTTTSTASWQWQDLGYSLAYQNGTIDPPDMNVALINQPSSTSTTATTALNTQFRTAGTVSGSWTNVGTPVTNLTDAYTKDGGFVYYNFSADLGYGGYLTLTNFGFTDADIPVGSSITGIEIQVSYGGFWPLTTPSSVPLTFKSAVLIGASGSDQPDLGTPAITFKDVASATSNDPTLGGNYGFRLMDIGAPTSGSVPPGKLGYNGIAAADVKVSAFGVKLEIATSPVTFAQNVYAGIDYVKVRFAYLPAANGIYLWNPNCVCYPAGGTPSSGLTDGVTVAANTTVTSATGNFVTRGVTAGMVVVIPGAGVAAATLVTTVASVTDATHIVLTTAPSTAIAANAVIKIFQAPVHAQIVKRFRQSGTNASSNAAGQIYLQFIQSNGTIGGPPARVIAANEQIRSWPGGNVQPDGGVFDSSIQYALTATTHSQNVMDWSALLTGITQPDGSVAPASKYQSITKNFYASAGLEAIYGVSGGGPAFYYDGVKTNAAGTSVVGNFSRILTGLPTQYETPRSVVAHQGHLFLGYYAGIVQQSDSANVLNFDPALGNRDATEYGFGERITGMASINGDSLAVWTQSTVQMIQGQVGSSNAYQSIISPTSGGIEYTIQPMANYMYADFRGITMIGATQKYGDFEIGHISAEVAPFLVPRLQLSSFFESTNTGIINSILIRNKNMARYFFADGRALSLTFLADGENPQFTTQYYLKSDLTTPFTMDVVEAFTESTGRDRIFAACADGTGTVYELERSNTFNGSAIPANCTMVPDTGQSSYQNKQFTGIQVYGQAQDYATFNLSRSANYDPVSAASGGNIISEKFGSSTATPTGNTSPFVAYGTSAIQIEGSAVNLRFDSGTGSDPSATTPQFSHVIQAISYNVTPLNAKQQ